MRSFLAAILLVVVGATAHADPQTAVSKRLALEAELVVIADRDMQTARIQQDTARNELKRPGSNKAYWQGRLDGAIRDERDASARYFAHREGREMARAQLRRIQEQTARR